MRLYTMLLSACLPLVIWAAPSLAKLECDGVFESAGFAICTHQDGLHITASAGKVAQLEGRPAFVAIPRSFDGTLTIRAGDEAIDVPISPRQWNISRVDGLPPNKIRARTAEEQARVAEGVRLKNIAWQSRAASEYFAGICVPPVRDPHRISSVFGSERILNGEAGGRVHNGIDYAAPEGMSPFDFVGTPVYAPAGGTVVLAEPDMYFEGGFVVLDHGAGVMSLFMHLDDVTAESGQTLAQGDKLGTVGSTGRSTGPHLHWGVRIEGAYVDPARLIAAPRQTVRAAG